MAKGQASLAANNTFIFIRLSVYSPLCAPRFPVHPRAAGAIPYPALVCNVAGGQSRCVRSDSAFRCVTTFQPIFVTWIQAYPPEKTTRQVREIGRLGAPACTAQPLHPPAIAYGEGKTAFSDCTLRYARYSDSSIIKCLSLLPEAKILHCSATHAKFYAVASCLQFGALDAGSFADKDGVGFRAGKHPARGD